MANLRWDPNKDLSLVQERLNQFFKDALYSNPSIGEGESGTFVPSVVILETRDEVILKAEIPGAAKEDIDIKIDGDVLVLKGERKFEKEVDQENYYRMECSYGHFQRVFNLPQSINKDEVKASFNQGILEIRLPKEKAKKQTRIPVD